MPIVPSSIALWVVNLSDRLIIINFMGAAANGIYAVANKIPSLYSAAYGILIWRGQKPLQKFLMMEILLNITQNSFLVYLSF